MARRPRHLAAGVCLAAFAASPAVAQIAPPLAAAAANPGLSYLTPAPLRANNPLLQKSRDYTGIPLAGWMLYPEFLGEAIYNDNLALTSTQPRAAAGVHLHPDLYALHDNGLTKTELFASVDAYVYPGAPRDTQIGATVGAAETYAPTPDLTIKGQMQFDRLGGFASGGDVIGPNGVATPLIAPTQANRAQASAAVQKSFGRLFLGASVNVAGTRYDALETAVGSLSQSYRNSLVTTLTQRGGYWITPLLYGYAETSENWRQYAGAALQSHGYRAVVGAGSDRLGLFRGEAFAGYQTQFYQAPLPSAVASPVLGAKLYWYPTRALTVSASADATFTDSSNPTPLNPRGDPARDLSASLSASYQLHKRWSATAFASIDRAYYLGTSRIDTTYFGSTRLQYSISRSADATLSYTIVKANSNAAGGGYVDDIASLGALYHF